MAENMFDRYRPAASPGVSEGNEFARFAARPTPTAAAPAEVVAKKPERTWGQALKDTGLGVVQGATNLLGSMTDAGESVSPTGIIRNVTGLARRALPNIDIPDIPETNQLAMRLAGKIAGVDVKPPTNAEVFGNATQRITENLSPALQAEKEKLANAEGFIDSAKTVLTSPKLLGQFAAEQVPNLLTLGTGSRAAAAGAAEGVVARAIAGGASKEAAEALATTAGKKGAEKFIVGANVAMEGGAASQQAQQDALSLPDEVWAQNEQYNAMLARGVDPMTAKRDLAKDTGMVARMVGGASGFLGGKISAPFEADVFTRQLARRPVAMATGAAREAAEETVQEGGSQLASNLAVQGIDPTRKTFEGVAEAAGTGAALGGVMGGGLAIGGASVSKRPQPTVEPAGPITRAVDPAAVDVVVPAARPFPQAAPGTVSDVANLVPAPPPPPLPPPPVPTEDEIRASRPDSANPQDPGYIRVGDDVAKQMLAKERITARIREAKKAGDEGALASAMDENRAYRTSVLRTDTIHDRIESIKHKDDAEARAELASLNGELDKRRAVSSEEGDSSTDIAATATDVADTVAPEAAAAAPVPAPPWIDAETGVMREPTDREIEEVIHGQINQATNGRGINSHVMRGVLVDQMGLKPERINPLMKKVKADRKKGLTAPVDLEQQLVDQVKANARPAIEPVLSSPEATADVAPAVQSEPEQALGPTPAAAGQQSSVEPEPSIPTTPQPSLQVEAGQDKGQAPLPESATAPDTETQPPKAAALATSPPGDQSTYDESPELLDTDITTPSGGSFTSRGAAEATAKRHEGARVFDLDDGTFTVRAPMEAPASQAETPEAPAAPAPAQESATAPAEESALEPTTASQEGQRSVQSESVAEAPASAEGTPAPQAAQAAAAPKETRKDLRKLLKKSGEQIRSDTDAQRRWNDGDRIFGFHELDEGGDPVEITRFDELGNFAADQLLAVKRGDGAGAVREERAKTRKPADLQEAAHEAATSPKNELAEPTEAQKEAGNYKKGHARVAGLDISIENPAGSRRRPEWPPLANHYGYFKGSVGADKDHVDVFLTENAEDESRPVFVVDQKHRNGKFDEHKVVMGAATEEEARAAYLSNYEKGWTGLQSITQMSLDEFKAWVKDPTKTTKPAGKVARSGPAVTSPKPVRPNDAIPPSVKAPGTAASKRKRTVEASTAPPAPIADVGEKIGGARKDAWKDRGLQVGDLEGMTGGEQAMFATKDNVWKPDFGQQIESGMEPLAGAAAKVVWGRVPKKPHRDTDDGRRAYVNALGMIRGILEQAKTLEDVKAAGQRFQAMTGETVTRYGGWSKAVADAPVYTSAWHVAGNSMKPFGWQYRDEAKAQELLDKGWPGESGWRSKYRIRESANRNAAGAIVPKFLVRDRAKSGFYHGDTNVGFPTREAAEVFAAELFAGRKTDPKATVKDPPRPHLDDIPRTGADHRGGKDVAAEDFRKQFGFRGVEFGNWAAQDERQKLINLAFDGLMDMAGLLNIPPAAVSLDGTLGLALGARGSGKAAAHYEPGKVVINMTKISGAGALAHEWGHAMDHYFGEFGQDKPYSGQGKYISGGRAKPTLNDAAAFERLRPEMQTAWRDVLRSIYEKRIDKAEKTRGLELHLEKLDGQVNEMKAAASKDPVAVGALAVMQNRRQAVINELDYVRGEADDATWTAGQSEMLKALEKEGMGDYWKRPTELLARSFEAYVDAKIKAAGDKSQYLVSVPSHPAWPQGAQLDAVSKAFDKFFAAVETKQTDRGTALFSKAGRAGSDRTSWAGFPDVDIASPFGPDQVRLSAHPEYSAAKAGSTTAAMAVTEGYITPELVARYKAMIGDAKPILVPVLAQEATGNNKIPQAFAERLGAQLGLQVDTEIVQSVRAHHTNASAYARIGNQAAFDGPVTPGQTYLILDDAVTVGGTLANLRGHIEANGGLVLGAGVLSGHPNSASIRIKAATEQRLREDFGDDLQTYLKDEFGFGIEHLTEGEAGHIRSARTLDELRDRIAAARLAAIGSGNEGDARRSQVEEGPRDAGLSTSGLPIARAQELKRELTKNWGDNGPSVIVVESAEDFPAAAKVDPGYTRAEGLYDGRPMVWINVGQIRTEERFAQVLAHEAIGHYSVERIVGAAEWDSISAAIAKLASSDTTSKQLQDVFADVRRRYGDLDPTTFAKESIAVMAERGIRNSFVARVLAAVRKFLRKVMPSRNWSEADVLGLLSAADGFLRAGRNADQRAETVRAYSFSRAQMDGRGQQFVDHNGGRFVQRGDQWYLADQDGKPVDFLTRAEAEKEATRTATRIEVDPSEGARRTWSVTLPNGPEISRQAAAYFSRIDQTATSEFKKWFGDSKVVDGSGNPLVVFHGTEADFDEFRVGDQGTFGAGIYFADTSKSAGLYAPDDSRLVQAYVSLKNPLRVDAEFATGEDWDLDSPAVGMVEKLVKEPLRSRLIQRAKDDVGLFDSDLTDVIKAAGHDGIIATYEDGSMEYVAFEPTQIKSATGNSGAFDSTNASILFSKPAADVLDDLDAVKRSLESEGVLADARRRLRELTPGKVKDALRQTWLGALTTRHLTELGGDYFSNIKHYSDYLAEMQADRNALQADAEEVAENARKWAGNNKEAARNLFDVMHQATIEGVDPADDYKPLHFRFSGQLHEVTPAKIKEALNVIKQQIRERSGDNKTDMYEEAKVLRGMPAREKARRKRYAPLVAKFNELPPEAQEIYKQFRDKYSARADQVEEALVDRIKDTDAPEGHKRKIIDVIRRQFESNRLQGVYFPLQRFGKYFVAAEKAGTPTFQMFERQSDMARAEKGLRDRGFNITGRGMKDEGKAKDAPSGTFVAEVMEKLNKAGVSNKTQDDIYQIYLQSMPEMSMRKHAIHRKSIPGFDSDGVRAFAYNMHHGSHQLARLRFSHKLEAVLSVLKTQQKNLAKNSDTDTQKIVAGDAILQELDRRHEWIMNPQDSAVTNLISSAGFVYYLGATPAAALVNLTQNALVTYPYLASRFGGIKAMNYLLAAAKDAGRTLGHIQKTLTDPDEQRAHAALQVSGALDKTQAHNLAGIAEGGMAGYNPAWSKAMEIIGWGFHKTEVVNREATGMAAYRLARAEGMSFDQAVKFAGDAIWDTHFDYSNANRARFMQSGTAKVLLMFRQYSLNMTWHLGRLVWQATKGESPEVKRIARRNLVGIMGMSSLFSGVLGLPMSGVVMGTLNALQASFGDDDEPWEAETEFRAFLVDMMGSTAADILLKGGVNAATGADIAGRTGLSEMWFRDADKELEGRGYYYSLLEQAAGPVGGILKNALVGKNMIDEGHTWRGVETMLPKGLKDVMKAGRYATQGVNTLRGDPLLEDKSLWGTLLQLNGFTPAKVASQYERNRELGNYEKHIMDRRQHLMDGFAMALRTGDNDARASLIAKIQAFNSANPEVAISSSGIRNSIQSRARYSAKAEAGMVINPKLRPRLSELVPN